MLTAFCSAFLAPQPAFAALETIYSSNNVRCEAQLTNTEWLSFTNDSSLISYSNNIEQLALSASEDALASKTIKDYFEQLRHPEQIRPITGVKNDLLFMESSLRSAIASFTFDSRFFTGLQAGMPLYLVWMNFAEQTLEAITKVLKSNVITHKDFVSISLDYNTAISLMRSNSNDEWKRATIFASELYSFRTDFSIYNSVKSLALAMLSTGGAIGVVPVRNNLELETFVFSSVVPVVYTAITNQLSLYDHNSILDSRGQPVFISETPYVFSHRHDVANHGLKTLYTWIDTIGIRRNGEEYILPIPAVLLAEIASRSLLLKRLYSTVPNGSTLRRKALTLILFDILHEERLITRFSAQNLFATVSTGYSNSNHEPILFLAERLKRAFDLGVDCPELAALPQEEIITILSETGKSILDLLQSSL